jgi:hypothetical protein
MAIDGLILEYACYVILVIYYHITYGVNTDDFLTGCLASVFILVGKICVALAVAEGIAAPAQSLANTQAVYGTLLTTFVSG